MSRALHAQVLEWFRLGQPEIAQAMHDSKESPISLSSLVKKHPGKTVQESDEFYFRIGLLNGNLLEPLLRGLEHWGVDRSVSLSSPLSQKALICCQGQIPGFVLQTMP